VLTTPAAGRSQAAYGPELSTPTAGKKGNGKATERQEKARQPAEQFRVVEGPKNPKIGWDRPVRNVRPDAPVEVNHAPSPPHSPPERSATNPPDETSAGRQEGDGRAMEGLQEAAAQRRRNDVAIVETAIEDQAKRPVVSGEPTVETSTEMHEGLDPFNVDDLTKAQKQFVDLVGDGRLRSLPLESREKILFPCKHFYSPANAQESLKLLIKEEVRERNRRKGVPPPPPPPASVEEAIDRLGRREWGMDKTVAAMIANEFGDSKSWERFLQITASCIGNRENCDHLKHAFVYAMNQPEVKASGEKTNRGAYFEKVCQNKGIAPKPIK
jgi:hypothetical protein